MFKLGKLYQSLEYFGGVGAVYKVEYIDNSVDLVYLIDISNGDFVRYAVHEELGEFYVPFIDWDAELEIL